MKMHLYTIYRDLPEYPSKFVCYRFDVNETGRTRGHYLGQGNSVEAARSYVPSGAVKVTRSEHDAPTIVENWL